jgi:hypothetical protein
MTAYRRGRCRVCDAVVKHTRTYCDEHKPKPRVYGGSCRVCGTPLGPTQNYCKAHYPKPANYRGDGVTAVCDVCPFLEYCRAAVWETAPLPCFTDSVDYPAWSALGFDRGARARKENSVERAIKRVS